MTSWNKNIMTSVLAEISADPRGGRNASATYLLQLTELFMKLAILLDWNIVAPNLGIGNNAAVRQQMSI